MAVQTKAKHLRNRTRIASALASLALAFTLGCGGGGGDSSPAPSQPEEPSIPLPVDPPIEDGRDPSTARVALSNGQSAADGFVIGNIEDAALAADGSMALIASETDRDERGVLRVSTDGAIETVFDASNAPPEVDLTSLARLRMAPTGEIVFQSGRGIDTDQLHRITGATIETLAGLEGAQAPDFRILGDFRIASGGRVAFAGGGGDCEAEQGNESLRYLCTVALFLADPSGVYRVDHPELELDRRQASDAELAIGAQDAFFVSVPGRRSSPLILKIEGGQATPVLRRTDPVAPNIGILNRIEVVALDTEGNVLVELGINPESEDDPIRDRLGILTDGNFSEFRREGEISNNREVSSLRGLGLGGGKALYEETLTDLDTGEQSSCLRLVDTESIQEIACVGASLPGEDTTIFEIGGARINASGDVLFVVDLGTTSLDTRRIEETRAKVRRADGTLVTIASSMDLDSLGTITELTSVGFNDAGQVLLIAERSRSSDRALLLGESR